MGGAPISAPSWSPILGLTMSLHVSIRVGLLLCCLAFVAAACTPTGDTTTTTTNDVTTTESLGQGGPTAQDPYRWTWTIDVPGSPTGVTTDEVRGLLWVTTDEGDLLRVASVDTATPSVETVASGLVRPRGVATDGSTVFVSELGDLPCPGLRCKGDDVDGATDPYRGELQILRESNGRVTAFPINADDSLGVPATVVDGLPVANTDHGVNGLVVSDGNLLVSIGHVDLLLFGFHSMLEILNADLLGTERELFPDDDMSDVHAKADMLGTIQRIDLATGAIEVVARGLRNVYDIDVDDRGSLWGADNDGFALGSWRRDELLRIADGDDYGFPIDGTAPPFSQRTTAGVWALTGDAGGPSGLEVVEGPSGRPGVMLAMAGRIGYVDLELVDGVYTTMREPVYQVIATLSGYPSAIAAFGGDAVVVADYATGSLSMLSWDSS